MGLTLVTPPASYPVTLAQARAQTRSEGITADDDYMNTLIAAATGFVEDYTGRSIIQQTWDLTLDEFADSIMLPKGPVQSITSVTYFDTAGDEQTLSALTYTLDAASDPQWLVLNSDYSWPATLDAINAVTIRFVAGYSTVPAALVMAIKFLISQWYDNREPVQSGLVSDVPNTVAALLSNHRAYSF